MGCRLQTIPIVCLRAARSPTVNSVVDLGGIRRTPSCPSGLHHTCRIQVLLIGATRTVFRRIVMLAKGVIFGTFVYVVVYLDVDIVDENGDFV